MKPSLPTLLSYLPFLRWPHPKHVAWPAELRAGFSVAMLALPQSVAYAALAGMPLVTGVYASLLPALMAVLFCASQRVMVGPTALTAMLVFASISGQAAPGSADWVNLAVWLALLTGLLQVVLGAFRFGWLLNLVSSPVLMAFTQGAALLIIASQLPALLGMPKGLGWQGLANSLADQGLAHSLGLLDPRSFGVGVLALLLLMVAKQWRPNMPSVLLVVLAAAGLSAGLGWAGQGVAVIGQLPAGLPELFVPQWPGLQTLGTMLLPVLAITLISFLETASSAKVDNDQAGRRWDADQDLIGQGLAKLVSGLNGSFATSSSFSRSALNLFAGGQSAWSGVVAVAVTLAFLLFGLRLIEPVPQSVLAAVVIASVISLVQPRRFIQLWRYARTEAVIAAATFIATLLTAPQLYWGVFAGVLLSLWHFLYSRLHPRILEVAVHPDGSLRGRFVWDLPPMAPDLLALRLDAALDFASAQAFEQFIIDALHARPEIRQVLLLALPINRIDATGVETFRKVADQLQRRGIALHLSGLKLPVEQVLREAGALKENGPIQLYRTDADAVVALARSR